MKNVRKHRDIKLVTTENRKELFGIRIKLSYYKVFHRKFVGYGNKKLNKLVFLGLPILELSKIVTYEFWYDYAKPKYGEKAKLCYMDTDSFTDDIYKNIYKENIETRFDTLHYGLDRPLAKGKMKK